MVKFHHSEKPFVVANVQSEDISRTHWLNPVVDSKHRTTLVNYFCIFSSLRFFSRFRLTDARYWKSASLMALSSFLLNFVSQHGAINRFNDIYKCDLDFEKVPIS